MSRYFTSTSTTLNRPLRSSVSPLVFIIIIVTSVGSYCDLSCLLVGWFVCWCVCWNVCSLYDLTNKLTNERISEQMHNKHDGLQYLLAFFSSHLATGCNGSCAADGRRRWTAFNVHGHGAVSTVHIDMSTGLQQINEVLMFMTAFNVV